jgi:hypothetical protein
MTLLSNDVKLHANDWTFMKLSAVEREIDNIFFWNFKFDDRKHQILPILFPHQSMYAMPNDLPIICQNLIIWKLLHLYTMITIICVWFKTYMTNTDKWHELVQYFQISNIFMNVQSFACNLTSFESKVIFLKRWV